MNRIFALWCALLLSISALANDILPADQAFIPTLSMQNNTVHVDFEIKDGYYMYQDKTSITPLDATKLGELTLSEAKIKDDPFFGKVGVYRNSAHASAEVISAGDTIEVEVGFQGCWDGGVCYPPIKQIHTIAYDATRALSQAKTTFSSAKTSNASNFFKSLSLEESVQDPVKADDAFVLSSTEIDGNILLNWDIRKDYYLYANKFNFEITGGEFGEINFPKGKSKEDDFFGMVDVYYDRLTVEVPVTATSDSGEVTLSLTYQGCWEGGVCYPPLKKDLVFTLGGVDTSASTKATITQATPSVEVHTLEATPVPITKPTTELNAQDEVTELLKNSSFWVIIGVFFLFGLALSFTPCVFPMIPILSNIIVGQGDISKGRAFFLSLIFVLAMALTYTAAGVIAGSFDINLIILFQNPYIVVGFALIFVALAFSMFGYFELKLPNSLNTKLTNISNNQKGGNTIGVAIMGLLSALIVGPCVAPPLAGSLLFISQTGDAALGGAALFAMAMGMGVPLLIIGSGIGSLPKAGGWMDAVKYLFGVLMLGIAIWMLDKILDPDVILILWALLLTIAPIALGATVAIGTDTGYIQRIYRAVLLIVLGYGVLLLLLVARGGVATGGHLFNPLGGMTFGSAPAGQVIASQTIEFNKVMTQADIDKVLASTDKVVMLDFYADWCVYCKVYEERVFPSNQVAPVLAQFELIKLDMTDYTQIHRDIMKRYDIFAPPAILFFQNGKELRSKRIVGELNVTEFYEHVTGIAPTKSNSQATLNSVIPSTNNTEVATLQKTIARQKALIASMQKSSIDTLQKLDAEREKVRALQTQVGK